MILYYETNYRSENLSKSVEIAIVGKYTTQSDTYTSIHKALEHAGLESNRKVNIKVEELLIFYYIKIR